MIFEGFLRVYKLSNVAKKGEMPKNRLILKSEHYYGDRMIGYSRQYTAMGADQRVDKLVRIWRDETIRVQDYVITEDDGEQYRIDMVQHLLDEDNLKVTDLTLYRLEDNYEIYSEEAERVLPEI